jgi:hypothetical protein
MKIVIAPTSFQNQQSELATYVLVYLDLGMGIIVQ